VLVLKKIDTDKLKLLIKSANYYYFIGAFIFITLAQLCGALRMRYNLKEADFLMSRKYSIGMYFLGTLLNIILPGGIGGAGFRAFYFHKRFKFPWPKTIMAILRGRSSGLFFLCLFLFYYAYLYRAHLDFIPHIKGLVIIAAILIFPAYSICTRYILKEPLRVQLWGLHYSFFSQMFFLLGIICVLHGINIFEHITGYIMVFMIANIVAVVPVSFGGIGLREFTYITLAPHVGLSSSIGVAASLLYYIIFTLTAFLGFIPYALLRKMDYLELKYQRAINFSKYAIVNDIKEEELEQIEVDGG